MKLVKPEKPLLLVVDPSLVFAQILNVTLRRAECEIEIAAFHQTEMAIFWLSREMDRTKAKKRPLATPWDRYPALRPPTIAIVSLGFPIDEQEYVMDWLYVHFRPTKIITTSTEEELHALGDSRDELYWRRVVSHLIRPVTVEEVIERVIAVLHS